MSKWCITLLTLIFFHKSNPLMQCKNRNEKWSCGVTPGEDVNRTLCAPLLSRNMTEKPTEVNRSMWRPRGEDDGDSLEPQRFDDVETTRGTCHTPMNPSSDDVQKTTSSRSTGHQFQPGPLTLVWTFRHLCLFQFWSFCLCYCQSHTFWHRCVFQYFTPISFNKSILH